MKQTSLESFLNSPNLKKYNENENIVDNPFKIKKSTTKKDKNDENDNKNASCSKTRMYSKKTSQESSESDCTLISDTKHVEHQKTSKNEDDYHTTPIKKEKKPRRNKRKKELDSSQSRITQFCSPEIKPKTKRTSKSKKADHNCNELPLEIAIEEMKKKWAKSDEQLKNLKEILELTRESEEKFRKRKEEERLEKQERLKEIERRKNMEIKHCKNLSLCDIQDLFEQHLDFLIDIKNGTRYSQRHELYNQDITTQELLYNDSCSAFTKEQIKKIIDLLHNRFDEGNPLQFSKYYWGVLLPELTLKIFMDKYNMEKEEALNYLKFMPDSEGDSSDLDSDDF